MTVTLVTTEQPVLMGIFGRDTDTWDPCYTLTSYVSTSAEDPTVLSQWTQTWNSTLDTGYELGDLYKTRYIPSIIEWGCLKAVQDARDAVNAVDLEPHYQPDGRESTTKWMYGYGTREDHGGTPAHKVLTDLLVNMMADLWGAPFAELIMYYITDSGESIKWCFDYARSTAMNLAGE